MYKIHVNIKYKILVLFKLLLMFNFINCIGSNDWLIIPSRTIPKTLNYTTLNSSVNNKNYYNNNNNIVKNLTTKSDNYNNDNFQPMYNSAFYNNDTGDENNINKYIIYRNSIAQIKNRNDDGVNNNNNYVTTNLQNQPITYYRRPSLSSSSSPIINYQQFDPATNMQTTVEPYFLQHLQNVKISVLTIVRKVKDVCSFLWNYFTKDNNNNNNNNNNEIESGRTGQGQIKVKKKFKNFMLPLLIAYKLKFLTLVPLVMGGLILLMGSTGMAGFFFAMFTAILSLKQEKH